LKKAPNLTVKFIDLFAGCGGLALGLQWAGLQAVAAVEVDPDAAQTYSVNVDARIHAADIESIRDWPQATVVVGGPPCQGFSQLGNRDPADPRNNLWRHFVRVLDASSAVVFVMENVPALLASPQFHRFQAAVRKRDFSVATAVLCAADYGVPQIRKRAFVIGSRLGTPSLPLATHGPRSVTGAAHRTVRTAFRDPTPLPEHPNGINWHSMRHGVRDYSITRYAAVPLDGGNRFQMQKALDAAGLRRLVPRCWRLKTTGTSDVFGRMWWDRPAPTIRTEFCKPEKGRYLHPKAHRAITIREAARLQSFPDDFRFPQSQTMTSVARQIGNAVPPLLAQAIGTTVLTHLASHGYRGLAQTPQAGQLELMALAKSMRPALRTIHLS
jgi:DNA (cytosine-5)-methyltransferase 1